MGSLSGGSTDYAPGSTRMNAWTPARPYSAYDGGMALAGILGNSGPARPVGTPNPLATGERGDDATLHAAQIDDQLAQLRAKSMPPPKKILNDARYGPAAWLTDPDAMNAYQRAAYLPGGSSMSGNINAPAPDPFAGLPQAPTDSGQAFEALKRRFNISDPVPST